MAWTNPKTWAYKEVLSSLDLNTYVKDNLNYIFGLGDTFKATLKTYFDTLYPSGTVGEWSDWTPTFENFTKGSATIVAKYCQIGKTVHFRVKVILAADSSVGTLPTVSLPVESVSTYATHHPLGQLMVRDSSPASNTYGSCFLTSTTKVELVMNITNTYQAYIAISATVPITWAVNDYFVLSGTYEAA